VASRLAEAHIEAERRLRLAAVAGTERIWRGLPAYDEANVDQWLSQVLPLVTAAQRRSVSLTDGYLGRAMRRRPLGVSPDEILSGLRNGTPPEEVYRRPFVTLWSALEGTPYLDAVAAGGARATGTAAMDVQLAMRGTAEAVNEADPNMYGFMRVADGGACAFCQEVDGAYVKSGDAMALHNNCGCGLEPLDAPHSRAASLPSGVTVHEHGELGAVLTSPEHDFTTESQALG
jgi:hypothetical protein